MCIHCGKEYTALILNQLRTQGKYCSKHCAALATRSTVTGGNEKHPLYTRWLAMKQRCFNVTHSSYKNYGGRGITVEPFLQDFKNYANYATSLEGYNEENLSNMQLDRIDNNIGYCRDNLRWVIRSANIANTRKCNDAKWSSYKGISYSIKNHKWIARIVFKGKLLFNKTFDTEYKAALARDAFIIQNNLPHMLNIKERATTISKESTPKQVEAPSIQNKDEDIV